MSAEKMTQYCKTSRFTMYRGDNREVLPLLARDSVDSIVVDPPYELGFMGRGWDRTGIAYDVGMWRESLRVLKPGGYLLSFGGTRTYHRMACAAEDAGFEIRDQLIWLFGSGFPKSVDIGEAIDDAAGAAREVVGTVERHGNAAGKGRGGQYGNDYEATAPGSKRVDVVTAPATDEAQQWDGWGTALKPGHEPILLARKPFGSTIVENLAKHGVGAINVDGCRVDYVSEVDRQTAQTNALGPVERSVNTKAIYEGGKQNGGFPDTHSSLGRWPANVIHDGSPEVVELFPTIQKSGETLSAARYFYCPKASKEDRDEGLEGLEARSAAECVDRKAGSAGMNSPRAGAGRTSGTRNHHPTVKPTPLMRYLCRLITPLDGVVLDQMAGSFSTGKAALLEGFRFVGIELDKDRDLMEVGRLRLMHAAMISRQK